MYHLPVLLAVFPACDARLFSIQVKDESTTVVPAGTALEALLGDFGFGDFVSMDITAASELRNQNVDPGDIRDVRMELLELEAVAPAGASLDFLNTLDVYVEAPDLERELLASSDSFPPGEALVALDLEDLDLTPYAVSQSMTFTTEVNGRRPEVDTDVTARFEVVVGVTGRRIFDFSGDD
jgi:hypothetical protein